MFPLCMDCGISMDEAPILGHLESLFNQRELDAKHRGASVELKEIQEERLAYLKFASVVLVQWKRGRRNREDPNTFWKRIGRSGVSVLDWMPSPPHKPVESPKGGM